MPDQNERVERTSVWIDKSIVKQAKAVATHKGKTLSEVIESVLRAPIAASCRKVAERMTVELGEAGS